MTAPHKDRMADTIGEIDTACVGELAAIKQERDRLEGYRARADERKATVDALVYRRVLDDYDAKRKQLDARAAPLTAAARTQYQALMALERRIQSAFHDARLAKEELEFRHAVGELSDEDLRTRIAEPEGLLAERQRDLDAVADIKTRFLGVVASEADLIEPPRAVTPPTPPPGAVPAAPAPPAGAVTIIRPASSDTRHLETAAVPPATPSPVPPTAPAGAAAETGSRTFLVPDASLEPVDDSTDGARFRLGVVTSIGRSAENHIRLVKAGVSRKHAVINLTDRGFVLEDLGSQNGTFVNGDKVPTRDLVDGDVIWIGDVKVMFKSAWTPPGAPPPAGDASGHSLHTTRRSRRT